MMLHKKSTVLVILAGVMGFGGLYLGGAAGCGAATTRAASGTVASVGVSETSSSGDFTPSVSFLATSDNALGVRVAPVDVNGDGTVGTPSVTDVTVASGDQIALLLKGKAVTDSPDCTSRDVGSGETDDQFDIAVSLDTTGSMGAAAGILASKVAAFATALSDAGLDVKFAGITVGDAFATKLSSGSAFTDAISKGSLGEPPSFDTDERPDTGADLLAAADMATFFDEVESAVGSGAGGNDVIENYLGPIKFGNDNLNWRSGAGRVFISIGDNCAYTPDNASDDLITGVWIPPSPTDLENELAGVATVHVVGNPESTLECSSQNFYNMASLATATGGTFTEIGSCGTADDCNVDLTTLPISSAITGGVINECSVDLEGETVITVTVTIEMADGGTTFSATFTAVLNVTET